MIDYKCYFICSHCGFKLQIDLTDNITKCPRCGLPGLFLHQG